MAGALPRERAGFLCLFFFPNGAERFRGHFLKETVRVGAETQERLRAVHHRSFVERREIDRSTVGEDLDAAPDRHPCGRRRSGSFAGISRPVRTLHVFQVIFMETTTVWSVLPDASVTMQYRRLKLFSAVSSAE